MVDCNIYTSPHVIRFVMILEATGGIMQRVYVSVSTRDGL